MFMDEQTVNEDTLFEASDVEVQGTEQTEEVGSPAVEETGEQSTSEEEATAEPAVSETQKEETQTGDEIDEFLAKKGIKSDDPDALRKVADMYRNVEKEFGRKSQEKAQLEREIANSAPTVSDADKLALSEVRQLKTELSVAQWKQAKGLTPEAERKMMDFCAQPLLDRNGQPQINPQTGSPITKGYLVVSGALSLDDVYKLSGGDSVKTDQLKANLKNEIANEMKARQIAQRPEAKATNSTQFSKPEVKDPFAEGLGI